MNEARIGSRSRSAVVAFIAIQAITAFAATQQDLLQQIPDRVGGELGRLQIASQVAEQSARQRSAANWLEEALAPLRQPACREVLNAFDRKTVDVDLASRWPADWPSAAAPGGERILLAQGLPATSADDLDFMQSTGLLPIEVALTAEWARAVGAHHAGPAPRDPLLRAARSARLEGTARLVAILVELRGSGVTVQSLGSSVLVADSARAGWRAGDLEHLALDPVSTALLRDFSEGGLRWALLRWLSGGIPGVLGALERPGTAPLDPGRGELPASDGDCRLGSRAGVALLGIEDPSWLGQIEATAARSDGSRAVLTLLVESESAAQKVQQELASRGTEAQRDGRKLRIATREASAAPRP